MSDVGLWMELWLVTEYHAPGSLFDCLNQSVFSVDAMLRMSRSIVSGLAHLHMDIPGTQGNASYRQHLSRVCYCFVYPVWELTLQDGWGW